MHMGMDMGMHLGMRLEQRFELRLELRHPDIPGATRGLQGIRVADGILKRLGAVGILIGGAARALWNGAHVYSLLKRKDVDVLVLGFDCGQHPAQFEGGIDWWVRHGPFELPTNGNIGIHWGLARDLRDPAPQPGLYLVPHDALLFGMKREKRIVSNFMDTQVSPRELHRFGDLRDDPRIPPVFPGQLLFMPEDAGDAVHCQPR